MTQDQLNSLDLFRTVALQQSATPQQKEGVLEVFRNTPLDGETIKEIAEIAEESASLIFSDPTFVDAAVNWASYTPDQQQGLVTDFIQKISGYLGFDVGVEFFNRPAVISGNQISVHGGFYNPPSNTINMNTIPENMGNFSTTFRVAFHELMHAFKFNQIGRLPPNEIVTRATNGSMSYTDALLAFAAMQGIGYAPPDVSFQDYQNNTHERVAFTGEHLWQQEAKKYGVTPTVETFTPDHPLYADLVTHGVA